MKDTKSWPKPKAQSDLLKEREKAAKDSKVIVNEMISKGVPLYQFDEYIKQNYSNVSEIVLAECAVVVAGHRHGPCDCGTKNVMAYSPNDKIKLKLS